MSIVYAKVHVLHNSQPSENVNYCISQHAPQNMIDISADLLFITL